MKNIFQKIDDYLLINNPVIWISSIHWIVGISCVIILLEIFIGLLAKFTFNVLGFHYIVLFTLVIIIFIWVMFQYRNYERVFSTKQTIKIYLLNFAGFFIIGISTLTLFIVFSLRLRPITREEDFSQDLLAIRIASLRNSDIELIKNYPQLFTSKGSDIPYNNTDTVDLQKEYSVRGLLDRNPFIKRNLSDRFNVLDALRKVNGYKYVDSLMTARESQYSQQYKSEADVRIVSYYEVTSELDEDPIFYKFLTTLTNDQLDSLRRHKTHLAKKYGFIGGIPDSSDTGMHKLFSELQDKIRIIVANSRIPVDKLILTLIILLAVYAISFNYIITKKTSSLLAPFVYLGLYSVLIVVSEEFVRTSLRVDEFFWFLVIANLVFFVCIFILLRLKLRFIGSGLRFFIIQMLNVSALFFPILLLTSSEFTGSGNIFHLSILLVIAITIVAFLLIQFFFIKKIHGTLVK